MLRGWSLQKHNRKEKEKEGATEQQQQTYQFTQGYNIFHRLQVHHLTLTIVIHKYEHYIWIYKYNMLSFSSLAYLSSSVSIANLSHLVAASFSSLALASSSMANLSCLLAITFSSLSFLSNSFSSLRFS